MTPCTLQLTPAHTVSLSLNGDAPIEVAFMGMPGLPGRDGMDGATGAATIHRTAGEALGGHRVVAVNAIGQAVYASSNSTLIPIGITLGAASAGADVAIQIAGEMKEPSWSWDVASPIFLGADGVLTQSPPGLGMLVFVGYPTGRTSFFIEFDSFHFGA